MRHATITSIAVIGLLLISIPARPCSLFTATDGKEVLIFNNEDWWANEPTHMWFVPPSDGKYGYVAWGFGNHFPQGGMNDQGLFWDGLATPTLPIENCTGKIPYDSSTMGEVMQNSATVTQAIENLQAYDYTTVLETAQLMFADANGDSAIFEGDITIFPEENYQYALNFYWSDTSLGGYPDWRLDVIEKMVASGVEVTLPYFTELAEAVSQGTDPGASLYTRYTTIGDLTRGHFYLFYDLDYENYVLFDLEKELAKGHHTIIMSTLFDPGDEPDAGTDTDTETDTTSGGDGLGGVDESDCGCRVTVGSSSTTIWHVLYLLFS